MSTTIRVSEWETQNTQFMMPMNYWRKFFFCYFVSTLYLQFIYTIFLVFYLFFYHQTPQSFKKIKKIKKMKQRNEKKKWKIARPLYAICTYKINNIIKKWNWIENHDKNNSRLEIFYSDLWETNKTCVCYSYWFSLFFISLIVSSIEIVARKLG